MKLLKGKRLQPDLSIGDQPLFLVVYSLYDQASIEVQGSGRNNGLENTMHNNSKREFKEKMMFG